MKDACPQQDFIKQSITDTISSIIPFDEIEIQHIGETLSWIRSGAQIFRLQKPDIPPKHLVCYFSFFDEDAQKIMLVDHKKAQLWVPAGGHVEINEPPYETVIRECLEEFNIEADFWCDTPIFMSSTRTVGLTPGHTDVSLWYLLKGNHQRRYEFDTQEFKEIQWLDFDSIPYKNSDPHLMRFIQKLKGLLGLIK